MKFLSCFVQLARHTSVLAGVSVSLVAACASTGPDTEVLGSGGNHTATGGAASGGSSAAGGASNGSGGQAEPSTGGSEQGSGGAGGASGGAETGSGGDANGASGGTTGQEACTPKPAGTFVTSGEVVFDEKTCLHWMKANTTGDPYAEAVAYCEGLDLGGYDDWRIPTAGEITTIFKCDGNWPPLDETIFTVSGDGIWTSTESGTIAGDLPKVCGAGQSSGNFYDFGQVGGQNTRCVRGANTLADRPDCKTNTQICP